MSTILFLNQSGKTAAQKKPNPSGNNIRHKRPRSNQRRHRRNVPPHVVVTKQPTSATTIDMKPNGAPIKNEKVEPPSSYFCLSLLCFCVCPLFAAFAIFFSSQVKPNHTRGNIVGAKMSSRFALLFCVLSVLTTAGIGIYLLYIFGLSTSTTQRDTLVEWWNTNWNFT